MKIDRILGQCKTAEGRLTASQLNTIKRRNPIRLRKRPEIPEARMIQRNNRLAESSDRPSRRDFERVLGTNDLVDINYLERAQRAAKAVCRVILRDATGRELGYGTGFKISPRLLLTNNHVLENEAEASPAALEFDYELDITGRPHRTTRFALAPINFFITNRELDFTIVAINPKPLTGKGKLDDYGFHRLNRDLGKINPGEFMTIIQHPSGQPKQIALRENQLIEIKEQVLLYGSDTAPGSSGSPIFNDTWQIVGLHHAGVPKTDNRGRWLLKSGAVAGPESDDSEIDWLANEGIRASRIVNYVLEHIGSGSHSDEFHRVAMGELTPEEEPNVSTTHPSSASPDSVPPDAAVGMKIDRMPGGARVTVPLAFDIQVPSDAGIFSGVFGSLAATDEPIGVVAPEAAREPIIDRTYGDRRGYKPKFLGIELPLPQPRFTNEVARMENGEFIVPYQHFSIVMHKERRLALFTAANVDCRPRARRPDPDRPRSDYTRKKLGGFRRNDREKWVLDPRIDARYQLPDRFYNKDRQSFDKGHLVRRDIVCWGRSYRQLQKANGDTYHCTNCSPQVLHFNRSRDNGIWGELENHIMGHAKTQKMCLFSGPVLQSNDRNFSGVDDEGDIVVKIPRAYWKIVVVKSRRKLKAYAFVLNQDLTSVAFEEFDPDEFTEEMISIDRLEQRLGQVRFPAALKRADQFDSGDADELLAGEAFVDVTRVTDA